MKSQSEIGNPEHGSGYSRESVGLRSAPRPLVVEDRGRGGAEGESHAVRLVPPGRMEAADAGHGAGVPPMVVGRGEFLTRVLEGLVLVQPAAERGPLGL